MSFLLLVCVLVSTATVVKFLTKIIHVIVILKNIMQKSLRWGHGLVWSTLLKTKEDS